MKTSFALLTVLAMAAMLVGGCVPTAAPDSTKGPASPTGTIEVRVTDAPAGYDIVSVNVTVKERDPDSEDKFDGGVWVHRAVAEQEQAQQQGDNNQVQQQNQVQQGEDGWIEIDMVEGKNPFNLKELEGGLQEILATSTVPAGNYTQIRMIIEKVVVTYTYEVDGSTVSKTVEATLPSGKLKFVRHFEVIDGETIVLLFDFIAEKSLVFTGATQSDEPKVIFKPVVKLAITPPNIGHLYLSEKDPDDWSIVEDGASGELKYNLSGPTFDFVFKGRGLEPNTDYSLIYYADFEDRFTDWGGNNPGAFIASGTSNNNGKLNLEDSVDLGIDLPSEPDANIDTHDYSGPPDYYAHAHGAKIWLVPSADYDADLFKVTTWDPSAFLFETDLINYDDTDVP